MITIFKGTNRPGSRTGVIADYVAGIYDELRARYQIADLAELPREVFERSSYEAKPPALQPLADKIIHCDGLAVLTPEYNGGMPGVLKYFIDMLPFPESFANKPVCFTGVAAGRYGALRPIEHLYQLFIYRGAVVYPAPVFLHNIDERLDENDRLKDPADLAALRAQAEGFLKFTAARNP